MAPMTNQQRKLLKQFSDALTIGDVGSMKFVCRDKIGAALLERVGNDKPHELFQLLEQKGLIMSDNLSWLREIFIRIQRFDLAEMIPGCPERQDSVDGGYSDRPLSSPLSPGISRYRSLLKELADDLTNNQVDEIKFLLNVPGKSRACDSESW